MDVSIRPSEADDSEALNRLWSDSRLEGMQYGSELRGKSESRIQLSNACLDLQEPLFRHWTILADGEFVGDISQSFDWSRHSHATVSMGWDVVPERWGEGIAPRAIGELISIGFEEYESVEFVAFCFPTNFR